MKKKVPKFIWSAQGMIATGSTQDFHERFVKAEDYDTLQAVMDKHEKDLKAIVDRLKSDGGEAVMVSDEDAAVLEERMKRD